MLLTQIEEVPTELGEPDCKLKYTGQNQFMIHSDKILTITEPNSKLRKKYEELLD